jgi:hypothetical protein
MSDLPFNQGTQIYRIFQLLSDGDWHCGKHELPGTQPAKAIQIIRQNGYEIENKKTLCPVCGYKTVHRRLISITPSNRSVIRSSLPESLKRRIKAVFKCVEAVSQREYQPVELEVDHRFPQVRWSIPEDINDPGMSDAEIIAKFQLLSRQNNLWKSRYCERCKQTSVRGTFIGINYFYEGGPFWPKDIPDEDERGCHGCFWYNPDKWRKSLNDLIAQKQKSLFP